MLELTKDEVELMTNVMPELNQAPENAPKPEQIAEWENMIGKHFVKVKDGKALDERIYAEPDHLFPNHDVNKNTVNYRFHIRFCSGVIHDKKGNETKHPRVLGEKLIDVEKFVKEFKVIA